jgi:transcriptional regulator with XRE-family HTH domain
MTSAALAPAEPTPLRRAAPWTTVIDGQRLRQLRRSRGLSQERLADLAGLGVTTVARLERYACPPCRTRTLARLAAALGEPPAAIAPADVPQPAPAAPGTRR